MKYYGSSAAFLLVNFHNFAILVVCWGYSWGPTMCRKDL